MRRGILYVAGILAASCAFSALMLRAGQPGESVRFTFIALALTAFVVLSALALLRFAGLRLRAGRRALAVAALVLVASLAALAGVGFVKGTFLWPSGEVVDGDFVVKSWSRTDAIGETATIRALYFRGREVTGRLAQYVHHPTRPAVIVYERNESYGRPSDTYAFDGDTFRTLRLAPPYGTPFPDQWSPDKTRLVLMVLEGLYVFDLGRWRASSLPPNSAPSAEPRNVHLAGWSPGSRRFAVIDYGTTRLVSDRKSAVTLTEWDAETLMARNVGCMPDGPERGAWLNTDYAWHDDSLVVTAEGPRDARCADTPQ